MAMAIPDPSLSVVQALEVLSPYWYGTGLPKCGDLSLGKSIPRAVLSRTRDTRALIPSLFSNFGLLGI